ncbi:TPA: flavodoxin domain-containing protein [Morganella morganii subsp. morganii]|uniref:Sulfite reductase [NADPH] flavoprotein alpha-component n=1 Tax=Morganella morganii TaxID=582 RepID=A0AAU8ZI38_MORMO|nr:flavodoxin domain-containing protein [Morganella morganii]HDU8694407.1 flavodoxin domain-containing protein [Morganella morganii subsp. morganii]AWC92720.1 sulfite reductase [Morganella morganii]EKW8487444.1 flavodoxin domain-containing protein [Morganella morganii]HAT3626176.1 sulfite reductase [Morganella morganii]HCU0879464.1 flavodoxin domain-containing protein [Morganella morganii]
MTSPTSTSPLSAPDWQHLQPLLDKLTPQQLNWLSAWCRERAAAMPSAAGREPADILLIAASQTGNARRVAESLRDQLFSAQRAVRLVNAGDLSLSGFPESPLVVLICATTGDGDAPEEALPLFHFLHSVQAPLLTEIRYAVLALGNRAYPQFCQAGKNFDNRLHALGAQRILPRAEADSDYQVTADNWISQLLSELLTLTPPADEERLSHLTHNTVVQIDSQPHQRDKPQSAVLRRAVRLTAPESEKHVCQIVLDIRGTGLQYQTGDALGVYPENSPELVSELLGLLWFDGTECVTLKGKSYSLRDALMTQCELTINSAPVVAAYAHLSNAPELLDMIADPQQLISYAQRRPVADMVREFAVQTSAQAWVDCLPPLMPRLYSISSSPLVSPDEVHLTTGVVEFRTDGRPRYGAATRYLTHQLQPGDTVACFVEHNDHFRLPDDPEKPVIMIGPGTGIAPFRAFLQQRAAQQSGGKNWLITGNPHEKSDFLYEAELTDFVRQGVLTELTTAWSRDQPQKIYVQDKLSEMRETVWRWLEQGAYVYVCGDAFRMAKDTDAALLDIIRSEGAMSAEEAQVFLNGLRTAKRYQRDVY